MARCLTPAEEVCCGEANWDYLVGKRADTGPLWFNLEPSALKICGCLTADSNSQLWAIDWVDYDVEGADFGTLWVYEDCFAKEAPALSSPADDDMVPADPCYCWNDAFVLKWDRQCNACSYDIQVSLDEDFTALIIDEEEFAPEEGEAPSYLVPTMGLGTGSCGITFYWRVRSADAEIDELIHSFWSEVRSFTVGQGPAAALEPVEGCNIICYPGASSTLADALTNIGPDGLDVAEIIWARAAWTNGQWWFYNVAQDYSDPAEFTHLENGRAYIIVVSQACTWEFP